ncbi:hypothetical protein [Alicyclobacillus macrosporangiidus]|uniref:Small subunit ribosomal protein S1 n=1 Tax=Alicyclobacillus macrosporangiidus TaxID=392015 RepID=A0A1I7KF50_9BACL|nr:hypothetical protein [Alicyclobacillus macrosporangiidus]SFU96048.1 hypothetical protein SAMN05421543_11592 [Alicyclobacillus macrosporangiidus]
MDAIPVYLNITAEGARINPQQFDSDEHALMMFMSWRSNDTVVQALVTGSERIKYYFNKQDNQQEWREEEALMIRFGPLIGHIPLSESGIANARQFPRYYNRLIAVMPDRFNPGTGERPLLLFSRRRAREAMQNANLPKMSPGTNWTGVIARRLPRGYIVDVGGFSTWLPLSLVDFGVVQPRELGIGEMVTVKIMPERSGKTIVVSRKDAMDNPYDLHKGKYINGSHVVGQVRVVRGSNGYAVLHDGVSVRFRRGGEREMFRTGTWVSLRITGRNEEEKVLLGTVEGVIAQPVA